VVHTAQDLTKREGITGDTLQLVSTAALFHDSGFLEGHDNHEERSCHLARTYLPQYEYTDEQVEAVCKLIMVTKLPQRPSNTLERILCDADLAYLGSNHYDERAEALYNEMKAVGLISDRKEWQQLQLRFLKAHQFYTQTALQGVGHAKRRTTCAASACSMPQHMSMGIRESALRWHKMFF
jgi:uncharacterized protein